MSYFVLRGQSQYGPYSLADLQRYVASGDIQLMDIVRGDGMAGPLPVSQVLGIQIGPSATLPYAQTHAQPFAQTPTQASGPLGPQAAASFYPDPPNLQWGLVLLIGVFTCGLFLWLWEIIQAAWVKKVDPQSKALTYYFLYLAAWVILVLLIAVRADPAATGLLYVVALVLFLVARYSLRASLLRHFSTAEPVGLRLGGIMTFFFGGLYFQYHLSNIVLRKQMARGRGF